MNKLRELIEYFLQSDGRALSELLKALLLSTLLASAPVWAAENDPQAQADDADQSSEELEEADIAESSDVEIAAVDDSDAPADEGRSRFIPTEEISQDLGVSFPVDI